MKKKRLLYLFLLFFFTIKFFSQSKGYFNYSATCSLYKSAINNKNFIYCFSPKSVTQKKSQIEFYVSYGFVQALLISTKQGHLPTFSNETKLLDVRVFPNPTTKFINISGLSFNKDDVVVKIFNLSGKLMFEKQYKYGNDLVVIPVDNFDKSFYLLSVSSLNERRIFKIIKE